MQINPVIPAFGKKQEKAYSTAYHPDALPVVRMAIAFTPAPAYDLEKIKIKILFNASKSRPKQQNSAYFTDNKNNKNLHSCFQQMPSLSCKIEYKDYQWKTKDIKVF